MWFYGRADYVIDSESSLALMSLPVTWPEVVRCFWDEHRCLLECRVMPGIPKTNGQPVQQSNFRPRRQEAKRIHLQL